MILHGCSFSRNTINFSGKDGPSCILLWHTIDLKYLEMTLVLYRFPAEKLDSLLRKSDCCFIPSSLHTFRINHNAYFCTSFWRFKISRSSKPGTKSCLFPTEPGCETCRTLEVDLFLQHNIISKRYNLSLAESTASFYPTLYGQSMMLKAFAGNF